MKKVMVIIVSLFLLLGGSSFPVSSVQAQTCPDEFTCYGGCTSVGQCVNNRICYEPAPKTIMPGTTECGSALIGKVKPPDGVADYNIDALIEGGPGNRIGLLIFVSNALKLLTVIAGLFVFGNLIYAGYVYITTAGNTASHELVTVRLTNSVIGIVLILAAYTAAAIIGLLFFGDASFILNPDLYQFGALAPPVP